MLRVQCREVGTDCDFVGKGQTEEELLMQFIGHIVKVHQLSIEDVMTPEMRENIKIHMRRYST